MKPLSSSFQCPSCFSPCDHWKATIITVMIYSPPGDRDAPFQSESYIGPLLLLPPRTLESPRRWGLLAASRLPENRTDTGIWRAGFQRNYRRIKRANWKEKRVRSEACHCDQMSLTNKPHRNLKVFSSLFRNLPHFSWKQNRTKHNYERCSHSGSSFFSALHIFDSDLLITWHCGRIILWTVEWAGAGTVTMAEE